MTPDQWTQVRELFDLAVELPQSARIAFVEGRCTDDEVCRTVRELLEADTNVDGFFQTEMSRSLVTPVFATGQLVAGRFRIVGFQGRGGMGEVYQAYDEKLHLTIGLKTIRRDWAPNREARERFQREIRVAREVSHPNLCRVFDLVEHPGTKDGDITICLTMEWLEGETLQGHMSRSRPWKPEDVLPIIRQVASALDALHAAGIIHRDLKPGNIILVGRPSSGWRAVVTDFGLAKPASSDSGFYESHADAQAGAPYFMAPEQLRNEKPTPASDVFSFGLVIDEMITESRAFDAQSIGALYYQRLWEQPTPPSRRSSGLSPRWEKVILRCLEKDPEARFETAGKAVEALTADKAGVPRRIALKRRARRWLPALIVVSLMAAVAFSVRPPHIEASMVVFRINDLGNDPDFRYLGGGLTAELVSGLSHVEGLSVKQYYMTRDKAPIDSIKERFHLDGDLQKYQDRVRLTMRLADAAKGNSVVWSQTFDRKLDNPLDLQAEVADRVVEGLEARVFGEAAHTVRLQYAGYRIVRSTKLLLGFAPLQTQTPTQNPAAYQAFIRGRQLLEERTPATVRSAVQSFERAIGEDPQFALACAALSDAYRAVIDGRQGPQDLIERSREYAERAVALNSSLPEAHAALAGVRQMKWDWTGSEVSYRTAISLDPKSPVAYRRYAGLVLQFGRFDEAIELTRKGLERDPYDYPGQAFYGMALMMARRYPEAQKQLEWTLRQKDFIIAHNQLGSVYAQEGRLASGEEAKRYYDMAIREAIAVRGMETKGDGDGGEARTPVSDSMLAQFYALRGDVAASHQYLQRLLSQADVNQVSPAGVAVVYSALGETDRAVSYLHEAARIRDRGLLYLKVAPIWDSIRGSDGYRQVLAAMRL